MANPALSMGTAPIAKLFVSLTIPVTLSLLVGGLYNVVDALFIARGINADALGGVSMVFPVQVMIVAIGGMIGNGMASIITRRLGAKDNDGAQQVTGCALVLSLLVGIVLAVVVILCIEPLLRALGVTPALAPYARDYLVICSYATPLIMVGTCLNNLARAEGKMNYLMHSIVLASVINIVLDPIAIYWLKWGVTGVALATVVAQLIALLYMLWLYFSGRTLLKIRLHLLRLEANTTRQILAIGLPTFFTQIGVSLVIGLVNALLGHSSLDDAETMISAYGIVARMFMFLFFPQLGMVIAYQTLCSYNYGAQQYDRVREISVFLTVISTVYCSVIATIMLLFPAHIVALFTNDPQLIAQGTDITRFVFSGFFVVGATSTWAAYFQAIGQARPAMFLSAVRIYIMHIPFLFIVPYFFGTQALWYTYPLASYVSFFIGIFFIRNGFRQLRQRSEAMA